MVLEPIKPSFLGYSYSSGREKNSSLKKFESGKKDPGKVKKKLFTAKQKLKRYPQAFWKKSFRPIFSVQES
jgi:hypothetical protein